MTRQSAAEARILEDIRERASRCGPANRTEERIRFFLNLYLNLKSSPKGSATHGAAAELDEAAASVVDQVLTLVGLLRFQHLEGEMVRAFRNQLVKAEELVRGIEHAIDQLRALDVVALVGDPPRVGWYASGEFVCEHGRIRKRCERAHSLTALVENTDDLLKATPEGPSRERFLRHRIGLLQQLESLGLGESGPSSSYCPPAQRDYASLPEPEVEKPQQGRPVDEVQEELIRRLIGHAREKGILVKAGLSVAKSADEVLEIMRLCFEGGIKLRDSLMQARRRLRPDEIATESPARTPIEFAEEAPTESLDITPTDSTESPDKTPNKSQ